MALESDAQDFSEWDIDFSQFEVGRQHAKGIGLEEIHQAFNAQTLEAGLRLGNEKEHLVFTSVFLAAMATKPFVIMSGVSGSGKTQLAMTFGEWLGLDRVLVQPVRPDWDSPQVLLGHQIGASEADDSSIGWHVPRTLAFILKAARDPALPYMLVLEEMNLAHVERYFADVLSGMESGQSIIPNLVHDGEIWRPNSEGPEYLPWPKNLYVTGSINVDETTYEFSPKVLDRAAVLEFRVTPDSLLAEYPPKQAVSTAPAELLEAFLQRTNEQELRWDGREHISIALKQVHEHFYHYGVEFGHRTFKDSLRFGSMLNEVGVTDLNEILDLIMVQRIIPKFDTARGFNQRLLLELSGIATYGPKSLAQIDPIDAPTNDVVLPRTLAKLRRIASEHLHYI
jgi:5-methylcytosine-specific restriction protein B